MGAEGPEGEKESAVPFITLILEMKYWHFTVFYYHMDQGSIPGQ